MSGPQLLSLPGSFLTPPATLPVAIDYPAALALRQMALVQDELPKYLLARRSAPCSTMYRICTAKCCWPPCGTRAHV